MSPTTAERVVPSQIILQKSPKRHRPVGHAAVLATLGTVYIIAAVFQFPGMMFAVGTVYLSAALFEMLKEEEKFSIVI
jgi:hypothetical protein